MGAVEGTEHRIELNFWGKQRRKNPQISDFMKIRPMGAELFNADEQTDRHDEANGRFSQFWERAYKCTEWNACQIYIHKQRNQTYD